jgi:hypothetical protein
MEVDERAVMVEIDIEEMKNDLVFRGLIDSGIEIAIAESHTGGLLSIGGRNRGTTLIPPNPRST